MSYLNDIPEELRACINNPKRARKDGLVTAIQFLVARVEAADSARIAARDELRAAYDTIADLQDQLSGVQAQFRDVVDTTRHVENRAQLLMQLRQLTAEGVPCYMQGAFIKHRKTGAIIAQVKP